MASKWLAMTEWQSINRAKRREFVSFPSLTPNQFPVTRQTTGPSEYTFSVYAHFRYLTSTYHGGLMLQWFAVLAARCGANADLWLQHQAPITTPDAGSHDGFALGEAKEQINCAPDSLPPFPYSGP